MPTYTQRLGLRKPDPEEERDLRVVLQEAMDKIDESAGLAGYAGPVAFPSTPYDGQLVYDTNAKCPAVYEDPRAAWGHAVGLPIVAATADVIAPYTGQMCVVSSTMDVHKYTGAAWEMVLPSGLTRHEARYYANTPQTNFASPDSTTDFTSYGTDVQYPIVFWSTPDVTPSANSSFFTINRAGVWRVQAGFRAASFGASSGGERKLTLIRNGTEHIAAQTDDVGSTEKCNLGVTTAVRLGVGDTIRAMFKYTRLVAGVVNNQNDAGAWPGNNFISMTWLRP